MARFRMLGVNYWRNKFSPKRIAELEANKFYSFFVFIYCCSQYSGVSKNFDSGAMAKVSDGYTIGSGKFHLNHND